MHTEHRIDLTARDAILKLLSDEEVAQVSTSETARRLYYGDEYVDLHHLEYGVRKAFTGNTQMDDILPSKAVSFETWNKVVAAVGVYAASSPLGSD